MAFFRLIAQASDLTGMKDELILEKQHSLRIQQKEYIELGLCQRYKYFCLDLKRRVRKFYKSFYECPRGTYLHQLSYQLRNDGTCENYTLKSFVGFVGGFLLTYFLFMFFVFQLNFKLSSATIMCSIIGCVLTVGLAFSYKVR